MNFPIAATSRILPLPYRGARLEIRQRAIRCSPGNAQHRIYGLGNYLILDAVCQFPILRLASKVHEKSGLLAVR